MCLFLSFLKITGAFSGLEYFEEPKGSCSPPKIIYLQSIFPQLRINFKGKIKSLEMDLLYLKIFSR